jgi:hypothetical protein
MKLDTLIRDGHERKMYERTKGHSKVVDLSTVLSVSKGGYAKKWKPRLTLFHEAGMRLTPEKIKSRALRFNASHLWF